MRNFDEHIRAIIELLEYDMWLITPDKHIDCVCKSFETKQADKACRKCLGTGYKIKMKKIKGVRQPKNIGIADMKVSAEIGEYFFKNDYHIKEDDILVWRNEVEIVTRVDRFCSDAEKPVYYRCNTRPKKNDVEIFLRNLYKIIGKTYYRR